MSNLISKFDLTQLGGKGKIEFGLKYKLNCFIQTIKLKSKIFKLLYPNKLFKKWRKFNCK